MIDLDESNFESQITNQKEAGLVYFTTLPADKSVQKEFGSFYKLHNEIRGAIRFGIFRVNMTDEEELTKFKKQYKIKDLADGKPVLRYYPNEVSGDRKLA